MGELTIDRIKILEEEAIAAYRNKANAFEAPEGADPETRKSDIDSLISESKVAIMAYAEATGVSYEVAERQIEGLARQPDEK